MDFDTILSHFSDVYLMVAEGTSDYESVRVLVSKGTNVNCRGPHGETPFHKSLLCDDPRICQFSLVSGAE